MSADEARLIFQEVAAGMEELRDAERELAAQAEQLAASHLAVDAERERYVQLFDFAPDAYLETDGLGKILEANSVAERLLGATVRFLVGKLIQFFVASTDVRAVRTALKSLTPGEPTTLEVVLKPREMPPVPVEMRLVASFEPRASQEGEVRVRWLIRDISERMKLDRELRQLHSDVELLAALADVNRLVAESSDPVGPMLQGLVELSVRAGGGAHAGILLADDRGRASVRAVSGPVAQELCDIHVDGGGPGLDVLKTHEPRVYYAADLDEWPALAEAVARHRVEWVFSQAIVPGNGSEVGVLNLYGQGPIEDGERTVQLLAEHAAGIIVNGRLYGSATELARQLATALESRGVIDQAKGILMAWEGSSPDEAFDILRRASQRENRKLRVIAEEIVNKATSRRSHS